MHYKQYTRVGLTEVGYTSKCMETILQSELLFSILCLESAEYSLGFELKSFESEELWQ